MEEAANRDTSAAGVSLSPILRHHSASVPPQSEPVDPRLALDPIHEAEEEEEEEVPGTPPSRHELMCRAPERPRPLSRQRSSLFRTSPFSSTKRHNVLLIESTSDEEDKKDPSRLTVEPAKRKRGKLALIASHPSLSVDVMDAIDLATSKLVSDLVNAARRLRYELLDRVRDFASRLRPLEPHLVLNDIEPPSIVLVWNSDVTHKECVRIAVSAEAYVLTRSDQSSLKLGCTETAAKAFIPIVQAAITYTGTD